MIFRSLGPKYIDGTGWNGIGFQSFQIMGFVDNSTPRPATFCGVARGPTTTAPPPTTPKWSQLLAAISSYIVAHSYQGKGYYYVQNEPQNQADADLAAYLANLSKTAAPNLRIAISEEPKPQIAENPMAMGKSYDLWWADLSAYKPDYAKGPPRLGETVWWYFLYGDAPPHFNPITIDHPWLESRIGHWAAWKHRVRASRTTQVTGWGADPTTTRGRWARRRTATASCIRPSGQAGVEHPLGASARGRRGLRVPAPRQRWRGAQDGR